MRAMSLFSIVLVLEVGLCSPYSTPGDLQDDQDDTLNLKQSTAPEASSDPGASTPILAFNDRYPVPDDMPKCPRLENGEPTFLACCAIPFYICRWWEPDDYCASNIKACCKAEKEPPGDPLTDTNC